MALLKALEMAISKSEKNGKDKTLSDLAEGVNTSSCKKDESAPYFDGSQGKVDGSQGKEGLNPMTLGEVLKANFPQKEMILDPFLRTLDRVMIYARRGVGKTLFTLQLACAIASGEGFLKWKGSRPRKVLYLDGEMSAASIQERCVKAVQWSGLKDVTALNQNLTLVSPDFQDSPLPNLSYSEGQNLIWKLCEAHDVIIIDSYLTLCEFGKINDAESFGPMEDFLLRLRKIGKTTILIHHSNKSGGQLGSIRKETTLETVLQLSDATDKDDVKQIRIVFDKTRDLVGGDKAALIAAVTESGWHWRPDKEWIIQQVVELSRLGLKQTAIGAELGISQSKVARILKGVKAKGAESA